MNRRRGALLVAVLAVAVAAPACGERDKGASDDLRAAIRATSGLSRQFSYAEKAGPRRFAVSGMVEDDLRYTAKVTLNDGPLFEEVVSDDAVADRLFEPGSLGFLAVPGAREGPAAEVLRSGQWVVDPVGAPTLLVSASAERRLGDDPVLDSLTVFTYIEQVLRQQFVREFDENALEYRPQEDPFPKPKEGSKVKRYDFFPPKLPKASDTAGSANQAVPGPQHFRKMVVYVEEGRIIRVLEQFDVLSRLDDLARNYDLDLDPAASPGRKAAVAIEAINAVRKGQGQEPIRVRDMSLSLSKLGQPITVALPTEGTVTGDLSLLRNRGKAARSPRAGVQGEAGGDGAATTAPAPPAGEAPTPTG